MYLVFWIYLGLSILNLTSRIGRCMSARTNNNELGDADTYESKRELWQILFGKFGKVGRIYDEEEARIKKKADEENDSR